MHPPPGFRVLGGGEPITGNFLEFLRGHSRVGGHRHFEERLFATGASAFQIALEQRGEGFLVLPLRMLRRERFHPVEREDELER